MNIFNPMVILPVIWTCGVFYILYKAIEMYRKY